MRENSGSLKKNANKSEAKHPDYKGKINIGGVEYWLAGWIKETENDDGSVDRWVSLAFDPVEKKEAPRESARNTYAAARDGDEIPF